MRSQYVALALRNIAHLAEVIEKRVRGKGTSLTTNTARWRHHG
jgi:hypothetical protein